MVLNMSINIAIIIFLTNKNGYNRTFILMGNYPIALDMMSMCIYVYRKMKNRKRKERTERRFFDNDYYMITLSTILLHKFRK